ncbi:MAG: ABC transporter ATP-binding protein [Acidobacteriota bacterium]
MRRLRRALNYMSPYWRLLVTGILVASGAMLCQLSFPWVLRFLIDDVFGKSQSELLIVGIALLMAAAAGTVVFQSLEKYVFGYLSGRALIDIRTELARHLRRLPLGYSNDQRSGRVMSLFTNDAPALAKLYETVAGQTVVSAFRLIATLVIIIVIYKQLAFLTLIAIPLYVIIPALIGKRTRQAAKGLQQTNADISADLLESIAATREIKAFNRERWDGDRLHASFAKLLGPQLRLILLQVGSFSTYLIFWTVVGVIYWIGGHRVLAGEMTLGLLIASVGYFGQLEEPVSRFVNLNGQLQLALGAGERIFEFLDTEVEVPDRPAAKVLAQCEGLVEVDNVSFAYGAEAAVLSEVTFTAYPGRRIAIVGPSGAGKSTLVSLIPRFFEPTCGRILIDGMDVRDVTIESLRNSIAMVFQDTFLFAASARENIRFGGLGCTEEEIILAAQAANAHEFILKLPEGYETQLGERGVRLSGGQRQRIAIARALLRNPGILILDEATSALDSESELAVLDAMERLMQGRTTFVIAHRLSTVVNADQILVLNHGRILDAGTHDELIQRCDLYSKLYSSQFENDKRRSPQWQSTEPAFVLS